MRTLLLFLIYLGAALLLAAQLFFPVYQSLAAYWEVRPDRVYYRLAMIIAILGFWPFLGALGMNNRYALGYSLDRRRFLQMLFGGLGAGILIKSFAALQGQDYGFDSSDLLTFEVHLPDARYEDPVLRVDFHQRFHEALRSIPGVESVAATSWLPAAGPYHDWGFRYETADGAQDWEGAQMRIIEGDYFETMGIPLRAGRTFNVGDGEDLPPVMVISETAAEIAFPGRDAIGQQFFSADADRTVIGVVPDVAFDARGSRKSKIYIPHTEFGDDRNWALVQVVKTSAGLGVLPQIRQELDAIDPELVIYRARTMNQVLGRHMQSLSLSTRAPAFSPTPSASERASSESGWRSARRPVPCGGASWARARFWQD